MGSRRRSAPPSAVAAHQVAKPLEEAPAADSARLEQASTGCEKRHLPVSGFSYSPALFIMRAFSEAVASCPPANQAQYLVQNNPSAFLRVHCSRGRMEGQLPANAMVSGSRVGPGHKP